MLPSIINIVAPLAQYAAKSSEYAAEIPLCFLLFFRQHIHYRPGTGSHFSSHPAKWPDFAERMATPRSDGTPTPSAGFERLPATDWGVPPRHKGERKEQRRSKRTQHDARPAACEA
jgi:hypothetical protein